jgi:hypothetical protein
VEPPAGWTCAETGADDPALLYFTSGDGLREDGAAHAGQLRPRAPSRRNGSTRPADLLEPLGHRLSQGVERLLRAVDPRLRDLHFTKQRATAAHA